MMDPLLDHIYEMLNRISGNATWLRFDPGDPFSVDVDEEDLSAPLTMILNEDEIDTMWAVFEMLEQLHRTVEAIRDERWIRTTV